MERTTDPAGSGGSEARRTALVADIDPAFSPRLIDRLSSEGWHVLTAAGAQAALDLCRLHAVDVVIASTRVPNGSGGRRWAELRTRCGALVVLLADGEPWEARVAMIEDGADVCVDRSSDLGPLMAYVRALVRSRNRPPSASGCDA